MITQKPIGVLFLQSQTFFGADTQIHSTLMKHMDRSQAKVYVALNYGNGTTKSGASARIEQIENLNIRRTSFGPTRYARSNTALLLDTIKESVPAFYSLGSLPLFIKRNGIEVIHCTEKPRDAFYGAVISRITGAKCVIHVHVKAENWISPKVQWAMHRAHGLIGVSNFVSDSLINMGFDPNKVFTVHNCLEIDHWRPSDHPNSIRDEFNIRLETPLLLIVSRLFYWKGHTELLHALALVKQSIPDFKLLIVGEDDPRAHPGGGLYSKELADLSASLGLAENVIFTGFRSDIPQLMTACDIYTMPSFEEPFGMVFLEAMAMKKPVVALDNGGSREIIKHGAEGLLSLPKDIQALAENIKTLILNPALRKKMGELGRKQVEDSYSPEKMANGVLSVYRHLLGKKERAIERNA